MSQPLETLFFRPDDFDNLNPNLEDEAEQLVLKINHRLRQAIDAYKGECGRHMACQSNYSEALGEIRGIKFAFEELAKNIRRESYS